jgi:hypothetical protein
VGVIMTRLGVAFNCPICNKIFVYCGDLYMDCQDCNVKGACKDNDDCHCDATDIIVELMSKQEAMRIERNIALREQSRLQRFMKRFKKTNTVGKMIKLKDEVENGLYDK